MKASSSIHGCRRTACTAALPAARTTARRRSRRSRLDSGGMPSAEVTLPGSTPSRAEYTTPERRWAWARGSPRRPQRVRTWARGALGRRQPQGVRTLETGTGEWYTRSASCLDRPTPARHHNVRGTERMRRRLVPAAVLASVAVALVSCGGPGGGAHTQEAATSGAGALPDRI